MKLYIAGPDVFRSDAPQWAEEVRALCRAAGHEALIPLDGDAVTAEAIYASNIAMIRAADAVIANLNPFRGAEPDSGTCFEVGFAVALGKRVIGYLSSSETLVERVLRMRGQVLSDDVSNIENFGLRVNLMLGVPLQLVSRFEDALAAL